MDDILSTLPGSTLENIAGWADKIKGEEAGPGQDPDTFQFLTDFPDDASRDWHYVNLPLGVSNYAEAAEFGFTRSDDVVQMIGESVRVLQGDSQSMSELNALRWIVHLVGDVHQPVHVGCGFVNPSGNVPRLVRNPQQIIQNNFRHDHGGNDLILPVSGSASLHSYWDSRLAGDIEEHAEEGTDEAEPFAEEADDSTDPKLKKRFIIKLLATEPRGGTLWPQRMTCRPTAGPKSGRTPHSWRRGRLTRLCASLEG